MLHGGVYGYIDEFAPFIPKLAENFQVICIATEGTANLKWETILSRISSGLMMLTRWYDR
jgi:hypothetical protein